MTDTYVAPMAILAQWTAVERRKTYFLRVLTASSLLKKGHSLPRQSSQLWGRPASQFGPAHRGSHAWRFRRTTSLDGQFRPLSHRRVKSPPMKLRCFYCCPEVAQLHCLCNHLNYGSILLSPCNVTSPIPQAFQHVTCTSFLSGGADLFPVLLRPWPWRMAAR